VFVQYTFKHAIHFYVERFWLSPPRSEETISEAYFQDGYKVFRTAILTSSVTVVFFVVHNTNTNGSNPIVECLGEARCSLKYCGWLLISRREGT